MLLHGDSLEILKDINNESIDCVITSPPYFGLRDYKEEGQLGLEATIEEYINHLIEIFNQVKRVLKKEGTCWVVIGDTYGRGDRRHQTKQTIERNNQRHIVMPQKTGYPKSMLMIPERFAIAMIDNGWILRNKIIWKKNNCMPSSATDRFTNDYEFIYYFTKSQKYYFKTQYEFKRIARSTWTINPEIHVENHFAPFPERLVEKCIDAGCPENGLILDPFIGSGTTAVVALKTNRKCIGIEINKEYLEIAKHRLLPHVYQTKLTNLISPVN